MSYSTKELIVQSWIANTPTLVYTSSAGNTIIDKLTTTNTTAGALTVNIYVLAPAGTATTLTLVKARSLAPDECYTWPEIVGKTIAIGAMIYAGTTAATSVNIGMSGRVGT